MKRFLNSAIPWGGIFLMGGILLIMATDLPDWVGWIAIIYGILNTTFQFIALSLIATGMNRIKSEFDKNPEFFTTNFGRNIPVKKTVERDTKSGKITKVTTRREVRK